MFEEGHIVPGNHRLHKLADRDIIICDLRTVSGHIMPELRNIPRLFGSRNTDQQPVWDIRDRVLEQDRMLSTAGFPVSYGRGIKSTARDACGDDFRQLVGGDVGPERFEDLRGLYRGGRQPGEIGRQ